MFEMIIDFYMQYAEHIVTFLLATCMVCAAWGKKWNWPLGLVGVTVYGMHAWFVWGLYADALLQIFYFATGIIGWYWWYKGGTGKTEAKVADLSTLNKFAVFALIAAGTGLMGDYMVKNSDSVVPYLDSFTTVTCLIAQVLLMMKNRFTWVLWVVADVVCVYLFYIKGLNILAVEYALFTLNAAFGYYMFTKLRKDGK